MPQTRSQKIPEEISDLNELKAWYEQKLERLGDEPALEMELELLRRASRFYCILKKEGNARFDRNDPNPYKGQLVSALMESGWDIKRGSEKGKTVRPDAIRIFEEALRIIPENPKACYRLGHLLKRRGKIGESVGYFSRALELASKQSNFQEDLKLNLAQIDNARGQSIALLQELSSLFEFNNEFTFDPEQIATLQNLLRDTYDRHVVHLTNVGGSIEIKTIDSCEYDDLIVSLKSDPRAFVIDRYNKVSLIRYKAKEKTYNLDTPRSGKLNYLLKAMGLEDWETSVEQNTITQTVGRVNDDLEKLGVDEWVKIAYLEAKFSSKCDLTVHYFKSLLD